MSMSLKTIKSARELGRLCDALPPGVNWMEPITPAIAQSIWNAARQHALEDAATKCDEWATQLTAYDAGKCATAETCAEMIRELKTTN